MNKLTLYGVPASPYVRAAAIGLIEKGLDFHMRVMTPSEFRSDVHLQRHPFGKIPSLAHGDFELYETQAILRYLDRITPDPSLTPGNPRAEARMNQLCGIADCYVMPQMTMGIAFDRLIAPHLGIPADEEKINANIPRAKVCVAEISKILGDKPFLIGESISIADLLLGSHLSFFAASAEGEAILKPHRELKAWLDRLSARPSFQKTTPEKLAAQAQSRTHSMHTYERQEEIL